MVPAGGRLVSDSRNLVLSAEDERAIRRYRERFGEGPFLAADAVVVSGDGRILLVQRSSPPGKGLWALPGGFVDRHETFLEAALRELKEETGLALGDRNGRPLAPEASLLRDAPYRDPRARIVSVAFLFRLTQSSGSLSVKGADDAVNACWIDLGESPSAERFFADHAEILAGFGLLPEQATAANARR
jgi:bifunctional NMN adenylyltransferase/nudix hydrolase